MPYINKEDRRRVDLILDSMPNLSIGELNYCITKLCKAYLNRYTFLGYKHINDIIGVLECAKMEFYRRVGLPYEDKKAKENGDVF